MKSNHFDEAIIALYPKVAIGSLSITSKIYFSLFEKLLLLKESSKLRALRAKNVLACQRALRAHVPCVLTCSRANVTCVLTCSRALRAYVPYVLTC